MKGLIGSRHAETETSVLDVRGTPTAVGGAQVLWTEVPGTSPEYALGTSARGSCFTIGRRTVVMASKTILSPFPYIAMHIM